MVRSILGELLELLRAQLPQGDSLDPRLFSRKKSVFQERTAQSLADLARELLRQSGHEGNLCIFWSLSLTYLCYTTCIDGGYFWYLLMVIETKQYALGILTMSGILTGSLGILLEVFEHLLLPKSRLPTSVASLVQQYSQFVPNYDISLISKSVRPYFVFNL